MPVEEWYLRHWPGIGVGEPVPGKCARCGIELRPGHRVSVRSVPAELESFVKVGAKGVVTSVDTSGESVQVDLEAPAAASIWFRRTDLFYIIGQKLDA